jgi:hypothetical protein
MISENQGELCVLRFISGFPRPIDSKQALHRLAPRYGLSTHICTDTRTASRFGLG